MAAPGQFDRLTNDVISQIALDLPLEDVLHHCLTSVRFNAEICNNENFWGQKVKRKFPNARPIEGSWKKTYMRLSPIQFKGKVYLIWGFGNVQRPFLVDVNEKTGRVKVFARNAEVGIAENNIDGIHLNNLRDDQDKLPVRPPNELYTDKIIQFDDVEWIFPGTDPAVLTHKHLFEPLGPLPRPTDRSLLLDLGDNKYVFIGAIIYSFTSLDEITEYYSPVGMDLIDPYAYDASGNCYLFKYSRTEKLELLNSSPELDRYKESSSNTPYGYRTNNKIYLDVEIIASSPRRNPQE